MYVNSDEKIVELYEDCKSIIWSKLVQTIIWKLKLLGDLHTRKFWHDSGCVRT